MSGDLELLTRRGCHLCEEAAALLRSAGLRPNEVDIDLDLRLLAEYDHRVPVVRLAATGEIVAEGVISEEVVRRLTDC